MTREPAKYIFHLKLGGGDRPKLAICAMAITAAKNGFRVLPTDGYGEMIPDLIIQREDRKSTRLLQSQSNLLSHSFFFNGAAPTEISTLSLHDALPIYHSGEEWIQGSPHGRIRRDDPGPHHPKGRSEEHTSAPVTVKSPLPLFFF